MAQQLHSTVPSDTYYVVILLLLAYVMSSAPRYVRDMKNPQHKTNRVTVTPASYLKNAVSVYAIQPYKQAWQNIWPATLVADLIP